MKLKYLTFWLIVFFLLLIPFLSMAQCAMCRASLESGGDVSQARGINNGIMYLMVFPYLLIGVVGFFIYRKFRNRDTKE